MSSAIAICNSFYGSSSYSPPRERRTFTSSRILSLLRFPNGNLLTRRGRGYPPDEESSSPIFQSHALLLSLSLTQTRHSHPRYVAPDRRLQRDGLRLRDIGSRSGSQRGSRLQHGKTPLLRMRPVQLQSKTTGQGQGHPMEMGRVFSQSRLRHGVFETVPRLAREGRRHTVYR